MTTSEKTKITVATSVNAPVEKVWEFWTEPKHIIQWNSASDDWHTPKAENDLRVGGKFMSRMEARDGSMGFDFEGEYREVETHKKIAYAMPDGREVVISFEQEGDKTVVTETFDAENTNPIEMQQEGWQAIMNNFKNHVESGNKLIRLDFEISINADAEKVYQTMLADEPYREWTSFFSPGSYYEGSWEKGSKILFLGPGENGETMGMVSRIKENIPSKFVSIEHLGFYGSGQEITTGHEAEAWAGAMENYTFREENGETVLSVSVDTIEEYKDHFTDAWPKALEKLKTICES